MRSQFGLVNVPCLVVYSGTLVALQFSLPGAKPCHFGSGSGIDSVDVAAAVASHHKVIRAIMVGARTDTETDTIQWLVARGWRRTNKH
jgi:hypothetical protein